ncbi:16477_t:CDS:1 [Acaulospora colombiana]|uniref:16477_t:CDS:1 n=1 Tax=Acaulospora colombiana TaxID=27376 RepID=A0ACA9PNJ3_9GLOM|nr:16477_t:CDS:1 [Acaulospora colombiana]
MDDRYMYSGTINLSRQKNHDILDLLIASDELLLSELFDHIQNYLLHTKFEWVKRNVVKVHRTIYPHEGCKKLQDFCLDTICKSPMLVFGSKNFLEFEEALLLPLLGRHDLQTEEIDIWDHLIRWGLAQMSELNSSISSFSTSSSSTSSSFVSIDASTFSEDNSPAIDTNGVDANNVDLSNWSNEDFMELERILHNCIPLIRFFQISSSDFYDKVWPFQKILPDDLREDVLQYHLKRHIMLSSNLSYHAVTHPNSSSQSLDYSISSPQSLLNISRYFQPPRTIPFDSTLLRTEHVALLCDWIDRKDGKPYTFDEIPYKLKLLVRGSRDGFEAETFHEKCDKQGATITVMQIACSGELIGGYNPIEWTTGDFRINTQNSFLFSFPKSTINSNNNNSGIGMSDIKPIGSNSGYSSENENRVNGNDDNTRNSNGGQSNERRLNGKLSRVRRPGYAIRIKDKTYGPCFGDKGLWMKTNFNAYDSCSSDKDDYSERVTTLNKFWVMEYEVFQVVKK